MPTLQVAFSDAYPQANKGSFGDLSKIIDQIVHHPNGTFSYHPLLKCIRSRLEEEIKIPSHPDVMESLKQLGSPEMVLQKGRETVEGLIDYLTKVTLVLRTKTYHESYSKKKVIDYLEMMLPDSKYHELIKFSRELQLPQSEATETLEQLGAPEVTEEGLIEYLTKATSVLKRAESFDKKEVSEYLERVLPNTRVTEPFKLLMSMW